MSSMIAFAISSSRNPDDAHERQIVTFFFNGNRSVAPCYSIKDASPRRELHQGGLLHDGRGEWRLLRNFSLRLGRQVVNAPCRLVSAISSVSRNVESRLFCLRIGEF